MELDVVPFQQIHLSEMEIKTIHKDELPKQVRTYAVTVVSKEKPLAVFGAFNFSPGVMHVWGIVSETVRSYPLAFHKTCEKLLTFYEVHDKPRRIQIEVRKDYTGGQRWAESLGFQQEGLMRKYGPDGSDYYLYARVK